MSSVLLTWPWKLPQREAQAPHGDSCGQMSFSERDFEGFEPEPEMMEEIASLGKTMGLQVNEDVTDLINEHSVKVMMEELKELHEQ